MNNIYMALLNRIKNFTNKEVYNIQAVDDAKYPYVVIKLNGIDNLEDDRDDYNLTVTVWDRNNSNSHAQSVEVVEEVRKALNNFKYSDDKVFFFIGRGNTGNVPDPDQHVKRQEFNALLKSYRR